MRNQDIKSCDEKQREPIPVDVPNQPSNSNKFIPEVALALYGLILNLLWEFGHSVLYLDHARDLFYVIWTRFHCSLGDALILLGSFWWTSLWFRTRFWFAGHRRFPAVVFIVSGLAYTAWSEWYNTQITDTWAYAPTMPTLFGLGLSPFAQWLIIPVLLLSLLKRRGGGAR